MGSSRNGPVLVCFAVREEAAPFRRGLPSTVTVLVSGMGAAAAERATKEKLAARDWRMVLTCGFAGGLNPALPIGAVLCEADENFPLHQALLGAGALAGRFHCAERVAVTAYEKATLRERTGADAVEMESGIIRRLCRERGIPSATVRVISDTAQEDLPLDFNALANPDQSLNYRKLALAIAKSPRKIPALLRLQRNTRFAAARLAVVLAKITE